MLGQAQLRSLIETVARTILEHEDELELARAAGLEPQMAALAMVAMIERYRDGVVPDAQVPAGVAGEFEGIADAVREGAQRLVAVR